MYCILRFYLMKFKSPLIIGLFLLICLQSFAQRPRYHPQVHEWAGQVYSARFVPANMDFYPNGGFLSHNPLNGIRYKYHTGVSSAIRTGLFYRAGKYQTDVYGPIAPLQQKAFWLGSEFSLGYERKIHFRKVQLFAGIDGLLSGGRAKEQVFNIGITGSGFPLLESEDKQFVLGYGASVNVGIRYFFNKYNSLTIENGAYYLMTNRETRAPGEGPNSPIQLMADSEAGFNLFSVYFSYHFKRMRKNCTCGKPGS